MSAKFALYHELNWHFLIVKVKRFKPVSLINLTTKKANGAQRTVCCTNKRSLHCHWIERFFIFLTYLRRHFFKQLDIKSQYRKEREILHWNNERALSCPFSGTTVETQVEHRMRTLSFYGYNILPHHVEKRTIWGNLRNKGIEATAKHDIVSIIISAIQPQQMKFTTNWY